MIVRVALLFYRLRRHLPFACDTVADTVADEPVDMVQTVASAPALTKVDQLQLLQQQPLASEM